MAVTSPQANLEQAVTMLMASVRLLFASCLLVTTALAQQKPPVSGEYAGVVGPYHIKLHLVATGSSISGTVDSPDAHLFAMQCTDFQVNGQSLSFQVPNVRGSWIGTFSPDGNTLTGMWNQGSPMPLNFARVGSPAEASVSTPAPLMQPATLQPVSTTTTTTDCPISSVANYWNGSSWAPLTMANASQGGRKFSSLDRLKNPFNPMAGLITVIRFKGAAASIVLTSSPRFCFPATVNQSPVYTIGVLEQKKGDREIEVKYLGEKGDSWIPTKNSSETLVKRISDRSVEVTPKEPLPSGQYIITGPAMLTGYDFGVQ